MAKLSYRELAKYVKVSQLEQINIEDLLSQDVVDEINGVLEIAAVGAVSFRIPQKGIEFNAYLEDDGEKIICSKLGFPINNSSYYGVIRYNGDDNETMIDIHGNPQIFRVETDFAVINDNGVTIKRGYRIHKKEIEKGE